MLQIIMTLLPQLNIIYKFMFWLITKIGPPSKIVYSRNIQFQNVSTRFPSICYRALFQIKIFPD